MIGSLPATDFPVGYAISVALLAIPTGFALAPLHGPRLGRLSFRLGLAINELPFAGLAWLLACTLLAAAQGDLASPAAWAACGAAVLTAAGLVVIARRGLRAGPAVAEALAGRAPAPCPDLPLARILFRPFFVRRRDVERVSDIAYGPAGKRNRLASQGWVCVSANYRLRPEAGFPEHLIDAKKVIAWVREHGHEYGADPSTLFVSGSSAGGHLASMAALTPSDPAFQPGFEDADTSVTGAISLYGYHGGIGGDTAASPVSYVRPDAPPIFVLHAGADTLVHAGGTRYFVDRLRSVSANPVCCAELPGAQHSFDLFHSLRFEAVVNGIEPFTAQVRHTGH
ncbi:alpha/beta hydrolase [Actinomadura darangshiensis]|uniref:Alpha/beta hydrolase n=2 Tax=Actinomadura darangshiensis TaxID=705336 RepID=A0A4R5ATA3_9ACTN|nr:alpha/beta hydrolase [Actinomadura darangshiensis]